MADVLIVRFMASREPMLFALSEITTSPIRRPDHLGFNGTAKLSIPSALLPARHSTNPLWTERHALPLPRRERMDRSRLFSFQPKRLFSAIVMAANPDADEAKPAAVGIVFTATTLKKVFRSGRNKSRKSDTRRANDESGESRLPFSVTRSALSRRLMATLDPSVPSERDRLGVTGRLSSSFLLPQYLHKAMFDGANAEPSLRGLERFPSRTRRTTSFFVRFISPLAERS